MRKKYKYKVSFRKITFYNRWKDIIPPDDWTIIGVGCWWSRPNRIHLKVCLFGFEIRIHFKREFQK
jgi:hypothetical protein